MKLIILGVLFASTLANDNISEKNQGNVGGSSHQSVSIDNQRQVVNVDNNNGWHSWNTVWDYGTGYAATRIFAKKICIVHKLNKDITPSIAALPQAIREKQKDRTKGPAHKEIAYIVSPKRITNLSTYGESINAMCRGLHTYAAYEVKGKSFIYFSESCFQADILFILGFRFCGETFRDF